MDKNEFFKKYGINEGDFEKTGFDWYELVAIREDHLNNRERLAAAALLVGIPKFCVFV